MTRPEEIEEFQALLGALTKKYEVQLVVSITDLQPKPEPSKSEPTPEV